MTITPDQARAELARRELARRAALKSQSDEQNPLNQEGTPDEALNLAKKQISAQYPNMPEGIRNAILSFTPKDSSPNLQAAANGISDVTNYIPAIAGGALQGASIPIRGVAGLIPGALTQNLANSPDLREYFTKPEGFGQNTAQMGSEFLGGAGLLGKILGGVKGAAALAKVPQSLQTPLSLATTGAIATPGDVTNRAVGAGAGLGLGAIANAAPKVAETVMNKLPEFYRGLTNTSTPEALVEAVQKPHDVLQNKANNLYDKVRTEIENRGIKTPINPEYIKQAEEVLPKTRANKKLIERAKSGEYDAVHDLQSHLYKKGTKGIASDDIAIANQGEEIIDLRDKINEDLNKHLVNTGHADIAETLAEGKKVYADLMGTYFNKNLPKGIGKLVHSETRLVPENPEKLFSQNSVPMKRFLEKHPDAATHAQGIKEKTEAIKALDKIVKQGASATGVGLSLEGLYHLLK